MLKRFLHALCFSNAWIALGAVLNFIAYGLAVHGSWQPTDALLVFAATFFLYNGQRIWFLPDKKSKNKRLLWLQKNEKLVKTLSVMALIICALLIFTLSLFQIGIGIVLLLVSVGYSYFPGYKPLRFFGILKTILVAVVWALVVFLFNTDAHQANMYTIVHVLRFLVMLYLLTLMFEYRDLNIDIPTTLPKKMNQKKLQALMYSLAVFCAVLAVYNHNFYLAAADLFLLNFLTYKTFRNHKQLFYSFYVDGYLVINAGVIFLEIFI